MLDRRNLSGLNEQIGGLGRRSLRITASILARKHQLWISKHQSPLVIM
jgi:hypothetical protein